MLDKLHGLAHQLFEVECERQNLLALLERVNERYADIQDSIFFLRPLYERETLEFENLVLALDPREAHAYTKDQYEKLLTKDIAV